MENKYRNLLIDLGNKQPCYVTNTNVVKLIIFLIYLMIYTHKSLTSMRREYLSLSVLCGIFADQHTSRCSWKWILVEFNRNKLQFILNNVDFLS